MDNNELRLAIAKAKVWKDVRYDKIRNEWVGTPFNDNPKVYLIINRTVPNWPEDIAAAWELLPDYDCGWLYDIYTDASGVHCEIAPVIGNELTGEFSDTAPRAICLAYLAWKEATK